MYRIEVPSRIEQIMSLFSILGVWRRKNRSDFCKRCLKITHLILCIWFTISLFAGILVSDNETETILIAIVAQTCVLHTAKLYYFLWKEDEIRKLIRSMGVISIQDHHEFNRVNNKINSFSKFVTILHSLVLCGVIAFLTAALPIISSKKRLPVNVYSPVNWKNNEINYWLVYIFTTCEILLCYVYDIFNAMIWYLMMCCGIRFQTLGNEFRNSGTKKVTLKNELSTAGQQDFFLEELITLIRKHQSLQEYIP